MDISPNISANFPNISLQFVRPLNSHFWGKTQCLTLLPTFPYILPTVMIFELSIDESWSDFLQFSKLENQELGGGICYKMVQDVARWCKKVKYGGIWCKMVQDGARWCKMVQDGGIWCKMMTRGVVPVQRRVRAAAYPPLPPPPRLLLAHNQILRL